MAASLIATTAFSLIQPSVSSLINTISGKGVMRLEKRKKCGYLLLLTLLLMMKILGKRVTRAGKGYKMHHMNKKF